VSKKRHREVRAWRGLVLGVALVIGSHVGRAGAEEPAQPVSPTWYAGIATGWYFPLEKPASPYSVGGGGVLLVGYQLSPSVSLRLEVNMSLLGGEPHDVWSLRVTPEIKWDVGPWRLSPFLWVGAGLAYQSIYPGPESTGTLVIPVGVGLQWKLDSRTRFFVQASYDILLKRLSVQSIPLLGGFEVHF